MEYILIWMYYYIRSILNIYSEKIVKLKWFEIYILIIFTGIRYNMGKDYPVYGELFKHITNLNEDISFEFGIRLYSLILKFIFNSSEMTFFVIALISIGILKKGINLESKIPIFSLLIYLSFYLLPINFNAVFQGVITAIFLNTLSIFKKRQNMKIFLLTLLCIFIHRSGIFIIISYIIYRINISDRKFLMIAISIPIITVLFYNTNIFFQIGSQIVYLDEIVKNYSIQYTEKVKISSLILRLILYYYIYFWGKTTFSIHEKKIFQIYTFGIIIYIIFSFNSLLSTRINLFFKVVEIILISNILYSLKFYKKSISLAILTVILFFVYISNLKYKEYYPYRTILEKVRE